MNTCLQNCKPGDVIKTTHGHTFIVIQVIHSIDGAGQVEVKFESGEFAGSFALHDIRIITKIIKVSDRELLPRPT